jgi:hypothetical protein
VGFGGGGGGFSNFQSPPAAAYTAPMAFIKVRTIRTVLYALNMNTLNNTNTRNTNTLYNTNNFLTTHDLLHQLAPPPPEPVAVAAAPVVSAPPPKNFSAFDAMADDMLAQHVQKQQPPKPTPNPFDAPQVLIHYTFIPIIYI